MLKIKSVLVLLILLAVLPSIAFAQGIEVTKIAPSQINFGDNLTATITVTNTLAQQVVVKIREDIGNAQAIEPQLITPQLNPGMIAARPPYFEWSLTIDANAKNSVSYTIKPNKVGDYLFSPTTVTTDDGKTFYSNTLSTSVKCDANNVCEASLGEDFTNCPEDCKPPFPTTQSNIVLDPIYIIAIGAIVLVCVGIFFFRKKFVKKKNRE